MSTSFLEQVQAEIAERWGTSYLNSFSMQMAAGDVGSQQGAEGGQQNGNGGGTGQQGQQQQEDTGEDYSIGTSFLSRVSPEHLPVVEPYVKQWDAGVTRRFQELHSQLTPYQELGDFEQLSAAKNILDRLEANPWEVYGILEQALRSGEFGPNPGGNGNPQGGQQAPPAGQQQTPPPAQGGQQEQGLSGLPPEVQQRFDALQQTVVALGQHILGQSQSQQEQQEQEGLNNYLTQMHDEFGDFDDDWILMQVYRDQDFGKIEDHINSWQEMTGQRQQQAQQGQQQAMNGLPQLLGGGGSPMPSDPASIKALDRKQVQSFVVDQLRAAAEARS